MGPVGTDPRWEKFGTFHDYMLKAFPLVYVFHSPESLGLDRPSLSFYSHSTLEVTKINTYGLIYVWKGTNSPLQPLLLAAHQG